MGQGAQSLMAEGIVEFECGMKIDVVIYLD